MSKPNDNHWQCAGCGCETCNPPDGCGCNCPCCAHLPIGGN